MRLRKTQPWWAGVLLLVTVHAAAAGSQAVSVDQMSGRGLQSFVAENGWILLRTGDVSALTLDWSAHEMEGEIRDDKYVSIQDPTSGSDVGATEERTVAPVRATDARARLEDLAAADATVLVLPAKGSTSFRVASTGDYVLDGIAHQKLEAHHNFDGRPLEYNSAYYEYAVKDSMRLRLAGSSSYDITGDFTLYLYGAVFSVDADEESTSYRTGYYETSNSNVLVREFHYVHAVLQLKGATLRVTTTSLPTSVYASVIEGSVTGTSMMRRASGSTEIGESSYAFEGQDVRLEDGAYRWSAGQQGMRVDIVEPPASIVGASSTNVGGVDTAGLPWLKLLGGLALGAVVAGSLVAVPRLLKRPRKDGSVGDWVGLSVDERVLSRQRAATQAESRGDYARAQQEISEALQIAPDDPILHLTAAIYLKILGRFSEAIEHHHRAHEFFAAAGDPMVAHNAYEAARAASAQGLPDQALWWLRTALDLQPALSEDARLEPDFAPLHRRTEFKELIGEGEVEFWRRP